MQIILLKGRLPSVHRPRLLQVHTTNKTFAGSYRTPSSWNKIKVVYVGLLDPYRDGSSFVPQTCIDHESLTIDLLIFFRRVVGEG